MSNKLHKKIYMASLILGDGSQEVNDNLGQHKASEANLFNIDFVIRSLRLLG